MQAKQERRVLQSLVDLSKKYHGLEFLIIEKLLQQKLNHGIVQAKKHGVPYLLSSLRYQNTSILLNMNPFFNSNQVQFWNSYPQSLRIILKRG